MLTVFNSEKLVYVTFTGSVAYHVPGTLIFTEKKVEVGAILPFSFARCLALCSHAELYF